jgi:hypothetical protein
VILVIEEATGYREALGEAHVSCQEMAEMGGGERLSRAAFTYKKMVGFL